MTLPFHETIVNDGNYSSDNFWNPNFIGYLNTYGEVLDYRNPLGLGGHDCDRTTAFFERYFRMPMYDAWLQQSEGINVIIEESEKWFAEERYKYFKERIEDNARLTEKYGRLTNVNSRLWRDLELFFYHCYQAETFMDGFGQSCMILNEPEFYGKYCKGRMKYQRKTGESEKEYSDRNSRFFNYDYHWYKKGVMLDWYKTVIVQYMHYHLVERCKRGITTCDLRPNETFYNYLLNDFEIHQITRMIFDKDKKMYVPYSQSEFLIPDSELRLQEEIQAIRKRVPIQDRHRYYR